MYRVIWTVICTKCVGVLMLVLSLGVVVFFFFLQILYLYKTWKHIRIVITTFPKPCVTLYNVIHHYIKCNKK